MSTRKTRIVKGTPIVVKPSSTLTVDETTTAVLTAIRQHSPADQNSILQTIIAELGIERVNKCQSLNTELCDAQSSSNRFFDMVNGKIVDEKLSAINNTKSAR